MLGKPVFLKFNLKNFQWIVLLKKLPGLVIWPKG